MRKFVMVVMVALGCVGPAAAAEDQVSIGNELVTRGVLGAREVNAALEQYVDRLKYQKSLAAGGARFDLEVISRARCRASSVAGLAGRSLASRRAS